MILMFVLAIFVLIALVGALPIWKHSKSWGFYPIGGVSATIPIILIWLFSGSALMHSVH